MGWLLEKDNPSVRYFAFTDILERSENDHEARETKHEIMVTGVVSKILALQQNGGYWETRKFLFRQVQGNSVAAHNSN